jgi:LEA14-like dessication related protein
MKKNIIALLLLLVAYSCDVVNQIAGAYTMTQCKYEYRSLTGLSLAGINLQNVSSLSSLNAVSAARLLAAFSSSSQSLPLAFTLNLDVSNPNTQDALLNGLSYILEIDGIEMTQGSLSRQVQVAAGGQSVLPVELAFDLRQALSGRSADAIKNLAFNFAGIGDAASNVTFRLKPTLKVGSQTIAAPSYIPVSFTIKK